jgi:hypothetical protein
LPAIQTGQEFDVDFSGTSPDVQNTKILCRIFDKEGNLVLSGETTPEDLGEGNFEGKILFTAPQQPGKYFCSAIARLEDESAYASIDFYIAPITPEITITIDGPNLTEGQPTQYNINIQSPNIGNDIGKIESLYYQFFIPSANYFQTDMVDREGFEDGSGTFCVCIPQNLVSQPSYATLTVYAYIYGQSISSNILELTVFPSPAPLSITFARLTNPTEGKYWVFDFYVSPSAIYDQITAIYFAIVDNQGRDVFFGNVDYKLGFVMNNQILYWVHFVVPEGLADISDGTGQGMLRVDVVLADGQIISGYTNIKILHWVETTLTPTDNEIVECVQEEFHIKMVPVDRVYKVRFGLYVRRVEGEPIVYDRYIEGLAFGDKDAYYIRWIPILKWEVEAVELVEVNGQLEGTIKFKIPP